MKLTHESKSNNYIQVRTHTLTHIDNSDINVFVVKSRPWTCAVVELGKRYWLFILR